MKHDFDNKAQLQIPHQPHLKLHIRRDKEDPQQFQNLKFNKLAQFDNFSIRNKNWLDLPDNNIKRMKL